MTRAAWALVPVLLTVSWLGLLAVPPVDAQSPNLGVPTQVQFEAGGVNVTTWLMHEVSNFAAQADPNNPLGGLFNTNFTAGSAGTVFFRLSTAAPPPEGGQYVVELDLEPGNPLVQGALPAGALAGNGTGNQTNREGGTCTTEPGRATCRFNATATADGLLQFHTALTMDPGTVPMRLEVGVFTEAPEEPPQFRARGNATWDLRISEAVPQGAQRATAGGVELAVWPLNAPQALLGPGCLNPFPINATVVPGRHTALCIAALTSSDAVLRVRANITGPAGLGILQPEWQSAAFNRTTGGSDAPVMSVTMRAEGNLPVGEAQLRVAFTVERQTATGWEQAGSGEVVQDLTVAASSFVVPRGEPEVNWLFMAPPLILAAGGLGYLARGQQRPKIQPRSQAMRDELATKAKGRRAAPRSESATGGGAGAQAATASAAEVERQKEEAREAAWEKKRKILEAKREDVLKTIRVAEERHHRGEITEHVLKGIRERKERQLEQLEREMEELR